MKVFKYGDLTSPIILVQAVDDYGIKTMEQELEQIRNLTTQNFGLIAVKVDDWNTDLSPWKAPAAFGKEDFGGGAQRTLSEIEKVCTDQSKTYYRRLFSGRAVCFVGRLRDGSFCGRGSGIAVCLVSGFFKLCKKTETKVRRSLSQSRRQGRKNEEPDDGKGGGLHP